jgi:hypothetical protein
MARPDRAAGLYGAINAISDRLDPLIRRFALNRPSQLISRTDSITAVQLSRKSGAVHRLDAAFLNFMPNVDPELDQLAVARHRVELAVPKRHPLTKLKTLRLRELTDAAFVWFPRRASPAFSDRLMHECYRGGLKAPASFRRD